MCTQWFSLSAHPATCLQQNPWYPRWRRDNASIAKSAGSVRPFRCCAIVSLQVRRCETSVHQPSACGGCQSVPCSSHKIDEVLCILQASGCVGSGVVPAVCTFCFSRCGLYLRLLHVVARCFWHLAVGLHWHDWCPLTRLVLAASTIVSSKLPRSLSLMRN